MEPRTLVYLSQHQAFSDYVKKRPEYDNIELSQTQTIVDVLIDGSVALVFVAGTQDWWRQPILAAKNNAATRRIPICFVSDERDSRAAAVTCGADLALSWGDLGSRFEQVVNEFGRIPDAATMERLACECRQPLPELAIMGLREFNRGEFYRQHDLFEAQWVKTEGPVRDLYRGILQVGVAYYQIERGNYRGALKMLQRSVQWLRLLPASCQGIDVDRLRRDSTTLRAELQRLGPERLGELDRRLLKKLTWTPS